MKILPQEMPSAVSPQAPEGAPPLALRALLCDGAALVAGVNLSALEPSVGVDRVLPWAVLFALLTVLPAAALGVYQRGAPGLLARRLMRLALVLGFAFAAFWLMPWPAQALSQLQWQAPLMVGVLYGARELAAGCVPLKIRRRFMVLGQGDEAQAVCRALHASGEVALAGLYPLPHPLPQAAQPTLSAALPLSRTARELGVTDIVVAVSERRGGVLPQDELLELRLRGVRIFDLSSFFEHSHGQVRLDSLRASWLIYGEGFRQGAWRRLTKRAVDVLGATVLLIATLPLMLVTALAIAMDSPGPIFYRQRRVGRAGEAFEVIKFRSMRLDAEGDGTPRWAARGDARITRVGRFIRRARIDELPQLWNVLAGQMSLIGPRPERPFFVEQLSARIPYYALRHTVKPGLTGWAQVRYHYGDSIEDAVEKLQYDLYYLKHGSLALDLSILLATVRVVLTGQGAH